MQQPRLTFACELDRVRLTALFSDASVIEDLKALGAHVILMLSDLSPERADVVQQLNVAGVPAVAVSLLPAEESYSSLPRACLLNIHNQPSHQTVSVKSCGSKLPRVLVFVKVVATRSIIVYITLYTIIISGSS